LKRSAIRSKGKPYKPVEVQRFHDWVAEQPCLVSGEHGVTLHHVTGYADRMGRIARSDWLVAPLKAAFHLIQHGPRWSVEALGHRKFYSVHGIDLFAEATRLAETWNRRAA
jgi:hypothetical protein